MEAMRGRVGVAESFAVMPGDKLQIQAYATYIPPLGNEPPTDYGNLAAQLLSAFSLSAPALGEIGTGHKRLVHYYKFYKRDSTRQSRKLDQHYKHVLDSAYRADRKQEKLRRAMVRKGIALPDAQAAQAESLNREMQLWWGLMKDGTSSDSTRAIAKEKVKTLTIEKAKRYPGFQNAMDKYQLGRDFLKWKDLANQVPGLDTLGRVFDSSPEELLATSEKMAESWMQITQFGKIRGLSRAVRNRMR
jgi:hypothetical protein